MNAKQAKQIPIQQVLERLGCLPVKARHGEWWYVSPFRKETEASFKLSQDGKAWYDHGAGRGGNLLDFLMAYFQTDLRGALKKLEELHGTPVTDVTLRASPIVSGSSSAAESALTVTKIQPVENQALTNYLKQRGIPLAVAQPYLQEIHYLRDDQPYFALAFANNSGGYELRNPYFKGTYGAKDITVIRPAQGDESAVAVFEGFMDFLSVVMLAKRPPQMPVIVMNSVSMKDKTLAQIRTLGVATVYLYLDWDETGRRLTNELQTVLADLDVRDMAELYTGYKDLNEWLISEKQYATPE